MPRKKTPPLKKIELTGKDTLRLIFTGHPTPMFVYNADTFKLLDVNDSALEKYGYTRDEFLELSLDALQASAISGEQRHRLKNGESIDTEVVLHPFKIDGQKATLVMAHDITQRKQAEKELLESKLASERYLNIVAELIVSLDVEGNITHLNESGHRLLGYEGGLIGKNWFETCLPEEEREEASRFFGLLKNRSDPGLESRESCIVTRDGERKVILWHNTVLRDQDGRVLGVLSSGEDITKRIEMEKALRIALAKYKILFECLPLGVTIADKNGNILETNPVAEKLLSVPRDQHTRRSIDGEEWHVIRPDGTLMLPDEYASVRALKENRLVENVEMGIVKPDSSVTWISVNATPLSTEGGGIVITYGDVTERKRTETLLQTRLRIGQFAETHTLDELLQMTLDEAEKLTGSQIGFAHFLHKDQQTLELQTWSTNTLKNMCAAEGKGQHYPVDKAGVWVDCVEVRAPVIHNDYAGLPASRRKGLPPGHAAVIRELVVPVLRGNLIVSIFGVGNKPTDYTEQDVKAVLQLANLSWDIIQRKRVEEALKDSERKYRMLHESMMDGFVRVEMDGRIVEYNHIYAEMMRYSEAELTALTYKDITPQKWHEFESQIIQNQVLKRGYSDIYEKEYQRKDGSVFPVELRTILMRNEQWQPIGMWAIIRDISERKQAEEALRESETRNRALVEAIPDLIFVQNRAGVYLDYHAANPQLLAAPPEVFLGRSHREILPPELAAPLQVKLDLAFATNQIQTYEYALNLPQGRQYFEARINAYDNDRAVSLIRDITERRRAEEALKESEWRNRIVSELTTDYIFVVDVEQSGTIKLKWASDNMFRITGRTIEDAATSDLWEQIIHPADREIFFGFANEIISTAKGGELECRTFYKTGAERWIHIFAWPQAGEGDKLMTIVGAIDDITERKNAEKKLENANAELKAAFEREKQLAHTDALTGVNNRRKLYELVTHEFEIATRYHQPLSVMMFDLDHFKEVNDTFGHLVGDQMLVHVTKVACNELRSADAIGRYGGEEFVILLPMTGAQQAFSLAERIRQNAAKIRVPTPAGDASVTLSIGIVEIKQGMGQDKSVDDLIRRADQAMYAAKQGGRNCVVISK